MFALSEMFDSFAGMRDKALKVMFSSYCCESKAAAKTKTERKKSGDADVKVLFTHEMVLTALLPALLAVDVCAAPPGRLSIPSGPGCATMARIVIAKIGLGTRWKIFY